MTKILIEIDTDTQRVVPKTLTSEMKANIEHQWAVGAAIDMAQREWDGALAAAPQPEPVDVDLRRDAELWRAHQKRKQDLIDRGLPLNPLRAAPKDCLAETVTIDASMLSQGEQK